MTPFSHWSWNATVLHTSLPPAFDLIIQITFQNTCLHMHPKGPQPEICFLLLRVFKVGLFVIHWEQSCNTESWVTERQSKEMKDAEHLILLIFPQQNVNDQIFFSSKWVDLELLLIIKESEMYEQDPQLKHCRSWTWWC